LNQFYSQRYGTLPIVRATGGLDDTVDNYDPATGTGTGFKLWDLNVDNLVATVAWAVDTYRLRPDHFGAMQRRAMGKRVGWDVAARQYADVYAYAVEARRGPAVPGPSADAPPVPLPVTAAVDASAEE
jgi:starch synthase